MVKKKEKYTIILIKGLKIRDFVFPRALLKCRKFVEFAMKLQKKTFLKNNRYNTVCCHVNAVLCVDSIRRSLKLSCVVHIHYRAVLRHASFCFYSKLVTLRC